MLAWALVLLCVTCGGEAGIPEEVVLASTTSTEDSGLFDVLLPAFQAERPRYRVRVVAVGSGEALALGRRKDADVLLVHSPPEEEEFMRAGFGIERRAVMSNDFVVAGPAQDPAGVHDAGGAAEALQRVASARAPFVSRGDSSGTHRKELLLWAERTPAADSTWYMEVGQGMGDALRVASERNAYVLTDRATFTFLRPSLQLEILLEGDSALVNPYSVITVAGARNVAGAAAFAEWLLTEDARAVIGEYGRDRFGAPLFVPAR